MLAVNRSVGIEQIGENPNRRDPRSTKGKWKEAGDKILSAKAKWPTILSSSCSLRSRSCRRLDIARSEHGFKVPRVTISSYYYNALTFSYSQAGLVQGSVAS